MTRRSLFTLLPVVPAAILMPETPRVPVSKLHATIVVDTEKLVEQVIARLPSALQRRGLSGDYYGESK